MSSDNDDPIISVAVPWKPKAKDRPRLGKTGHVYTPKETRMAEERFAEAFKALMPADFTPIDTPISVSWAFSKDHVLVEIKHHNPHEHRTLRADIDNYVKLVSDSLNGVAYVDDRQIVAMEAVKL